MGTNTPIIRDERMRQIADALLNSRSGTEDWGPISRVTAEACSKRIANQFLLCCLLDYQVRTGSAWKNGARLIEGLGDPDDIWAAITSVSKEDWESKFKELHLHRFPAAHNRLWRIGKEIGLRYQGDARKIWHGLDALEVRDRLWILGAGEQISRMIVGALLDIHYVQGSGDVKADTHICRVLGRIILGEGAAPQAAIEFARRIHPSDPWQLDWPLWNLGRSLCYVNDPQCDQCKVAQWCCYAVEKSSGAKAQVSS